MDDVGIEYQTVLGYPPADFVHLAADLASLDVTGELGAGQANVVTMDPDLSRSFDQFAAFAAAAAERGLRAELNADQPDHAEQPPGGGPAAALAGRGRRNADRRGGGAGRPARLQPADGRRAFPDA